MRVWCSSKYPVLDEHSCSLSDYDNQYVFTLHKNHLVVVKGKNPVVKESLMLYENVHYFVLDKNCVRDKGKHNHEYEACQTQK